MDVAFIEKMEQRNREAYKDRKFLYLFPNANGNYFAVNYDACNCALNSFLTLFDVWGNKGGHHKVSEDGNHQEVWFEVDEEFFKLATETKTFNRAFKGLGIKVVTEYPFSKKKDKWSEDWKGMAKAYDEFKNVWSTGTDRWDKD